MTNTKALPKMRWWQDKKTVTLVFEYASPQDQGDVKVSLGFEKHKPTIVLQTPEYEVALPLTHRLRDEQIHEHPKFRNSEKTTFVEQKLQTF